MRRALMSVSLQPDVGRETMSAHFGQHHLPWEASGFPAGKQAKEIVFPSKTSVFQIWFFRIFRRFIYKISFFVQFFNKEKIWEKNKFCNLSSARLLKTYKYGEQYVWDISKKIVGSDKNFVNSFGKVKRLTKKNFTPLLTIPSKCYIFSPMLYAELIGRILKSRGRNNERDIPEFSIRWKCSAIQRRSWLHILRSLLWCGGVFRLHFGHFFGRCPRSVPFCFYFGPFVGMPDCTSMPSCHDSRGRPCTRAWSRASCTEILHTHKRTAADPIRLWGWKRRRSFGGAVFYIDHPL